MGIPNSLKKVCQKIAPIDISLLEKAQKRLDNLTKPLGSLGRLEEIAKRLVAITGEEKPSVDRKVIFTLAADHGVAQEGVSAYPQEVTPQMVYNFIRGGAGINVLARLVKARVVVVDIGVGVDLKIQKGLKVKKIGYGTRNIAREPAMSYSEAIKAIESGCEIVAEELKNGIDIVGTGDMGIGNTTPSSAIVSVITGREVKAVTGRGTGIDDHKLLHKIKVIEEAIRVNSPHRDDPIDILAKLGGFEIAGLVGVILSAAQAKLPVVIDGFISGAAALIAAEIEPKVKDYLFAAHCSVEVGHRIVLDYLQLQPLLDLNLRLGEGTGAALAMTLIEASTRILKEMATFSEAGVSTALSE
jgi:nicotinate-nucleotide--dimethylbenzimidazole phosphoribosyltransferase